MRLIHTPTVGRPICLLMVCCLLVSGFLSTGCATLISGTERDVTFIVYPEGSSVYYEGREIRDGETVMVRKSLSSENRVNVGTRERPRELDFQRELDPWFIGSCALLIVFVIPGVVAIAVDLITGAAMEPVRTQNFNVAD